MASRLRVVLFASLVTAAAPTFGVAQDISSATLLRRIEQLERANSDLERRIRELELAAKIDSASIRPVLASKRWQDMANWRRLRMGLKPDEVRVLLGEPERIEGGVIATWKWPSGEVTFYHDRVDRWSEPKN